MGRGEGVGAGGEMVGSEGKEDVSGVGVGGICGGGGGGGGVGIYRWGRGKERGGMDRGEGS